MTRKPVERQAELRLDAIGGDRLEVTAIGAFSSDHFDAIAQRLTRLTQARHSHVHMDCSQITSMDTYIAELFRTAASRLQRGGGDLMLNHQPAAVRAHNLNTAPVTDLRSHAIVHSDPAGPPPATPTVNE